MEIITANFKKDAKGKRSLHILFKDEDNAQRWLVVSESSERFTEARELFAKYSQANDPKDEDTIAREIVELLDTKTRIRKALSAPTAGTFTIKEKVVYYNGEPLNEHLSAHIIRMFKSDSSPRDQKIWESFAKFVENLQKNTDPFIRDQLFSWLASMQASHGGFTITDDGHFLAYKGCPVIIDGVAHSGWSGNASVLKNGEVTDYVDSQIPNEVGTKVFMKRSEVEVNPEKGCGPGLHFSTLSFAKGYSRDNNVFLLKIHPSNVVSIPTDCNAQKGRCDLYEIIDIVESPLNSPLYEAEVKENTESSSSSTNVDAEVVSENSSQDKDNNSTPVYDMTDYQRGEIFAGLSRIGIENWEKTRALQWLSVFLGRTVDSRKSLTYEEAEKVLKNLKYSNIAK